MLKSIYIFIAAVMISLSACNRNASSSELVNQKASLPASFNFDQLGLKVLTSSINKKDATTSTLYGNQLAFKSALSGSGEHQVGEVFALVTWKQQPDEHWFGAKIPGDLQSVEVVKALGENQHTVIRYKRFEGKQLTANTDTSYQQGRINNIFGMKPAVMP
jgi:hypothetical protein